MKTKSIMLLILLAGCGCFAALAQSTNMAISSNQQQVARLQQIIIPSVILRNGNLEKLIPILEEEARKADPRKEGIRILFLSHQSGQPRPYAPSARFSAGPILEVVSIAAEMAGMKAFLDVDKIVVAPVDYPVPLVLRYYSLNPQTEVWKDILKIRTADARDRAFKEFFTSMGVPFPKGSSITYDPHFNRLTVVNDEFSLRCFERLLAECCIPPQTLRLHFALYEISVNDVAKLRKLLPPPAQSPICANDMMKRTIQVFQTMGYRQPSLTVDTLCRSGDQGREFRPLGRRKSQFEFVPVLDVHGRCSMVAFVGVSDADGRNIEAGDHIFPSLLLATGDTILWPLPAQGVKTETRGYCVAIRYDGPKR